MTVSPSAPCISYGDLVVRGRTVLANVPATLVVNPLASGSAPSSSAFIGVTAEAPNSRHVLPLGMLAELRWLCLFRFKIWWMIPRMGSRGSDIPMETQVLLLEAKEEASMEEKMDGSAPSTNTFYVLFLAVLDGLFRASFQGGSANELQVCLESGDPDVKTKEASEAVFVNSGTDPFELFKDSIKILSMHKKTFGPIEQKKKPEHLDWFGWCTWDAFYTDVNPNGIREGLQSLSEGGTPPRFLIVDDGWQEGLNEFNKELKPPIEGTQFATRLNEIRENERFLGLSEFIRSIREKYKLKSVYLWHALAGCWGGVNTSSHAMQKYLPRFTYPVPSIGDTANIRDIAMDSLEKYGVGLIHPEKIYEFYNDLHTYLSNHGVDGVKVDVQSVLESLGAGMDGRVALTTKYQKALEESVSRNFELDNLICCMCHNTESIYSSGKSAVARASEDFMPAKPELQTVHIASVAYNSLLLGEIFVPDWDMFQSDHETADFHGAARAVGGCGVYVSDKPGKHNFDLLRRLVLPDGSVLRAKFPGRPTRDCLFDDPIMDGRSLLKIWNMNKFSGVLGVFNCQGMGNWPMKEEQHASLPNPVQISGKVSPSNIEYLEELAGENWTGDCAVYAFNSGTLSRLQKTETTDVSLSSLQYEIFIVSPIKFAAIGLVNMYNSGGAIEELGSKVSASGCVIEMQVRSPGRFGAYSSMRPEHCSVEDSEVDFTYEPGNGLLTFYVSDKSKFSKVQITYP
ncbi:Galactinol--sucrose galactosyltransferase [Canna indica]|uniref:galactinol--sucrose galactosyltransferase n=1 Tax=Canna indica TaxID=4628 RepID=A0AAQ3K9P6_9LILI|nr:Galactinol--sucrose galactosyltransferase [Canna indica]